MNLLLPERWQCCIVLVLALLIGWVAMRALSRVPQLAAEEGLSKSWCGLLSAAFAFVAIAAGFVAFVAAAGGFST